MHAQIFWKIMVPVPLKWVLQVDLAYAIHTAFLGVQYDLQTVGTYNSEKVISQYDFVIVFLLASESMNKLKSLDLCVSIFHNDWHLISEECSVTRPSGSVIWGSYIRLWALACSQNVFHRRVLFYLKNMIQLRHCASYNTRSLLIAHPRRTVGRITPSIHRSIVANWPCILSFIWTYTMTTICTFWLGMYRSRFSTIQFQFDAPETNDPETTLYVWLLHEWQSI